MSDDKPLDDAISGARTAEFMQEKARGFAAYCRSSAFEQQDGPILASAFDACADEMDRLVAPAAAQLAVRERVAKAQEEEIRRLRENLRSAERDRGNLAMMLRRMIWQAKRETGDTSMKALAGTAQDLLKRYGLEGSPLRTALGQEG